MVFDWKSHNSSNIVIAVIPTQFQSDEAAGVGNSSVVQHELLHTGSLRQLRVTLWPARRKYPPGKY